MNYANDLTIKYDISYEELNKRILKEILDSGKVCSYYIADIKYNNMELAEPFFIDLNNMCICWVNDWYEGGTIRTLFGFVDSITLSDFVFKYLWTNRYKGGFEHESNHN